MLIAACDRYISVALRADFNNRCLESATCTGPNNSRSSGGLKSAKSLGPSVLPDGRFLVTERPGRLRVIEPNGEVGEPILGLPSMVAQGQGGLLDVLLDTDFAYNKTLYFCFSEPGQGGNSTALARARLSSDRLRLEELKIIFTQKPKVVSSAHFGCRIVESQTNGKSDGMLYLTLGDRYSQMNDAQTLNNHQGKIVRIYKDGRVPDNNPFVKRVGSLPEIWSYGHRNVQGAVLSTVSTPLVYRGQAMIFRINSESGRSSPRKEACITG